MPGGVAIVHDGWQELNASSRRLSEMASWRGLCLVVDCSGLMIIMMMGVLEEYLRCLCNPLGIKREWYKSIDNQMKFFIHIHVKY
jgi:hypothetical protein